MGHAPGDTYSHLLRHFISIACGGMNGNVRVRGGASFRQARETDVLIIHHTRLIYFFLFLFCVDSL